MRASLSPLAAVEARRLLTHPILLMGAALSAFAIAFSVQREGQLQSFLLMGLAILPLALGTFVAANQAALRSRRDDFDIGCDRLPDPLDFHQPLARRRDDLGERAEFLKQILGERFDVAHGYRAKQDQLEHLVIGERVRPRFEKAGPQSVAMAVEVRRCFG